VDGAPISNLYETVTNGGLTTGSSVSDDVDSGGVFGTIPSTLNAEPGSIITVYTSQGGTELYQYTVGSGEVPTSTTGTFDRQRRRAVPDPRALHQLRHRPNDHRPEHHLAPVRACPSPPGKVWAMELALQITLVVTSVLVVLLVLLHRAKGGGLSTLFGGGVQSSLSGSTVVEKNLDRLTLFVVGIWLVAIIGVGAADQIQRLSPRRAKTADRP